MEYRLIKSNRKSISMSIGDDLVPIVRAPYSMPKSAIDEFVLSNTRWIKGATASKQKQIEFYNITNEEVKRLRAKANEIIPKRIEYYSNLMNLHPTGIKITSAKKRFGSCNGKNSLCFSYFLMKFSDDVIDYVVIHELAHIKHHNHSRQFYDLVEQYMPDYKQAERKLKSYS